MSIGVIGDVGSRAAAQEPRVFIGVVLILAFASALGLYGLIVGMILLTASGGDC